MIPDELDAIQGHVETCSTAPAVLRHDVRRLLVEVWRLRCLLAAAEAGCVHDGCERKAVIAVWTRKGAPGLPDHYCCPDHLSELLDGGYRHVMGIHDLDRQPITTIDSDLLCPPITAKRCCE